LNYKKEEINFQISVKHITMFGHINQNKQAAAIKTIVITIIPTKPL
jgi:hypothetical protein